VREEVVRLKHHADVAADRVGFDGRVADVTPVERHDAVIDRLELVHAGVVRPPISVGALAAAIMASEASKAAPGRADSFMRRW